MKPLYCNQSLKHSSIFRALLALSACALTPLAFAQAGNYQQCLDKAQGVSVQISNCIAKDMDVQSARMNNAYEKLLAAQPDKDLKKTFEKMQNAWLISRRESCENPPASTDGTSQDLVVRECYRAFTAERADILEQIETPAAKSDVADAAGSFKEYASTVIGKGLTCRTGAMWSADGEALQAVVQVHRNNAMLWQGFIEIPDPDFYQARATHCVAKGNAIYVLEQVDTQSQQSLSQTLLYIVKFSKDGKQLKSKLVDVPDRKLQRVWSSWIEPGKQNFQLSKDSSKFSLKGKWRNDNSRGSTHDFAIHMDLF